MLPRQIGLDDLRARIRRSKIHADSFPAALPIRVGEKASQNLRIEIALAIEVAVESTARQPCMAMMESTDTFSNPLQLNNRRALSTIFLRTRSR